MLPAISPSSAVNLYVGLVLFAFVAALVPTAWKGRANLLLAVFLGLVAVNFLGNGLVTARYWTGPGPDLRRQLALLTLALDPLYLLLFVTAFPYQRRPRHVQWVVAAAATMAVASVGLVATRSLDVLPGYSDLTGLPVEAVLFTGGFALAYMAAWVLAVRTAVDAPTPSLARRSQWLVAATGLVVVSRMGLVPLDLDIDVHLYQILFGTTNEIRFTGRYAGVFLALSAAALVPAYAVGHLAGRNPLGPMKPHVRDGLRFVRLTVLVLFVFGSAFIFADDGGPGVSAVYGARWIVFAAVFTYGVLAYEVVAFRRAAQGLFPALGAYMAGTAAFLTILVLHFPSSQPAPTALAASLAIAAAAPGALVAQRAVSMVERRHAPAEAIDRRFELYRAALEAAWAERPPDREARKRLEHDRVRFGVDRAEARTLEHVVARSLRPSAPRLEAGDEPLPGIRLTDHLGDGAQGRVFLAHDLVHDQELVVKEVRSPSQDGQLARRRVLRELRALEGLDHPRIARLLGVRTPREGYLLLYEKVEGRTLAEHLAADGPMTEDAILRLACGLLEALEAAHAKGLVHRDLKPDNILVDAAGEPYLVDFGIASLATDAREVKATVTNMERLGMPMGTLAYMAPEQARGETATPATDLYALGLVLAECLGGKPARDLRGQGIYQALDVIAQGTPDLAALDGRSPAWQGFVRHLLARDPRERPASAAAALAEAHALELGTAAARRSRARHGD